MAALVSLDLWVPQDLMDRMDSQVRQETLGIKVFQVTQVLAEHQDKQARWGQLDHKDHRDFLVLKDCLVTPE